MLTKQDYLEHLSQIREIEGRMVAFYGDCREKVEDAFLKEVFNTLHEDEKRHGVMLSGLIDIVKK